MIHEDDEDDEDGHQTLGLSAEICLPASCLSVCLSACLLPLVSLCIRVDLPLSLSLSPSLSISLSFPRKGWFFGDDHQYNAAESLALRRKNSAPRCPVPLACRVVRSLTLSLSLTHSLFRDVYVTKAWVRCAGGRAVAGGATAR
jgi:hypothetical protein